MDNYDTGNNKMKESETNSIKNMTDKDIKKSAELWFNRTGGACCIHFAISIVISAVVVFCLCMGEALAGKNEAELMESIQSGKNLLLTVMISYIVANISAAVICLAFIKKLKSSPKKMFSKPEFSSKYILLAIPAAMFIQTVSMLLQSIFVSVSGSSGIKNMQMPSFIEGDITNNILFVAYVVFIGPITEEILFRGAVMKGFNFASRKFAIIMSAVMFAFFHGNILQGIIAFLLGIFFGYLDMKAGSIIPSVILHITNNGIATILEYIQYKNGEELSDIFMIIYIGCSVLIGIVCMIVLMRALKDKKMSDSTFFTPRIDADKTLIRKCGIKAAVKCPLLWIFIAIYTVMIIYNII